MTEALEHTFDASAWATLGRELDMPQLGDADGRLQESLRLRDDDYGYFIAQFLRQLQGERPSAVRDIAHRPEVKAWLDSNAPDAAEELGSGETRVLPVETSASASIAMGQARSHLLQPDSSMGPDLLELRTALRAFATARNWEQFHSPKNLAAAMAVEASEVLEHFQWLTDEQSRALPEAKRAEVAHELADVFLYLMQLADKLDVDLVEAAKRKMQINAAKYPAGAEARSLDSR